MAEEFGIVISCNSLPATANYSKLNSQQTWKHNMADGQSTDQTEVTWLHD
jgi:hypothetical protein